MKQQFRIAISRKGIGTTHYVIRDDDDLVNIQCMIVELLNQWDDIEHIKWVPIPALEEVVNDE